MIENNKNLQQLPKGWVWTRVVKIGEVETGTTPRKNRKEYYGNEYPFFKPTDLNAGYYVSRSEDGLSKEGIKHARFLPEKSVLVTCVGATIGKTGFIRIPGASNQQINAIIPDRNLLPEFIYFVCISPQFQKSIIDNASATTLPILNKSKFEILTIPLPPLPEQHRIVAKIEELFTKLNAGIEALKKVKAQLKRYRQAVLKSAFGGELTKEWREAHKNELESASVLLGRIKEERRKNAKGKYKELPTVDPSYLPELPKGWVWTRLGDIGEINPKFYGDNIPDDLEISFIPMRCVDELTGCFDSSLVRRVRDVKKGYTPFINGDVIFAKITPCMENGKVAVVQSLKSGIGFGSTEFHVIRLPQQFPKKLLFFFLIQEGLRKDARRNMTGSAGQLRVPAPYMQQILTPFPPLIEQLKIVEEIERHFSVADEIEKVVDLSLKQAERLRQSILKKAFEGRLVSQDPSDEPAEKLLERIKEEKAKLELEGKTKKQVKKGD